MDPPNLKNQWRGLLRGGNTIGELFANLCDSLLHGLLAALFETGRLNGLFGVDANVIGCHEQTVMQCNNTIFAAEIEISEGNTLLTHDVASHSGT